MVTGRPRGHTSRNFPRSQHPGDRKEWEIDEGAGEKWFCDESSRRAAVFQQAGEVGRSNRGEDKRRLPSIIRLKSSLGEGPRIW